MQKLLSLTRKALNDYDMIQDGDRVAVGLSGGKDSITLLTVLAQYQKFSPQKFELIAINIDMGFKDTDQKQVQATLEHCKKLGVELHIEKTDIAEIIFDHRKEKSPCSLCSKMRRGALNTVAIKLGCNKLALGHHADDVIETFFLSLLYEGRLSTFMPKSYMDRSQMTLIRPFIYIEEKQISGAARRYELPVIFNPCPRDKHTKREDIKLLINQLDGQFNHSKKLMLSAIYSPERNNLWDKMLGGKVDFDDQNNKTTQ